MSSDNEQKNKSSSSSSSSSSSNSSSKALSSIDSSDVQARSPAADVIAPQRPPPISPIDNAGADLNHPFVVPSPATPSSHPTPPSPPETPPTNPTDLQLYLFDPTRQVLIPFRADYSTSIPFTGAGGAGAGEKTFTPLSINARVPHPRTDKKIGVIVPLIKIAPNSADWMQLVSIAQRQPYPDIIAIVNPSLDSRGISGTGSPNAVFANGINYLVNAGIRVVGYVNTDKMSKTIATAQSEISKWFDWYPQISGIYFDDMSTDLYDDDDDDDDNPAAAAVVPSVVGNMIEYYKNLDELVKQRHKQVQGRHGIQQQGGYNAITLLNLAAGKSPSAATTKPYYEALFKDTSIDIITIYEQEGYPTEQNFAEIKREWMSNFPRSRFAIIAYHAGETDIEIRNFVDKATEIEKIAGYIYATTEWITNMSEATALSPLTGTILDQMSQLAQQNAIPSARGGGPSNTKPTLESFPSISQTSDFSEEEKKLDPRAEPRYDRLGVRMIYPTALGASSKQWSLRRDIDPAKDENLRNLPKGLRILDNGIFETRKQDADQVRIEAWSKEDKKFLNVEISGYFRVIESEARYLIQQYARTGHHYKEQSKWCEGSAYKGRVMKDGAMCAVKEVHHNAYANNRGITQATNKRLLGRWFGMKTVIYNYHIPDTKSNILTSKIGVAIELWIDDNADDGQGNLVVKNDWRHVATVRDQGGWFASEFKSGKGFLVDKCKPMSEDNKGKFRKRDEILNMPGGTATQNCIAWRWDDATVQFSHLSVREIQRIAAD